MRDPASATCERGLSLNLLHSATAAPARIADPMKRPGQVSDKYSCLPQFRDQTRLCRPCRAALLQNRPVRTRVLRTTEHFRLVLSTILTISDAAAKAALSLRKQHLQNISGHHTLNLSLLTSQFSPADAWNSGYFASLKYARPDSEFCHSPGLVTTLPFCQLRTSTTRCQALSSKNQLKGSCVLLDSLRFQDSAQAEPREAPGSLNLRSNRRKHPCPHSSQSSHIRLRSSSSECDKSKVSQGSMTFGCRTVLVW